MKWFRHRVDAHTDVKIQKLVNEFHGLGYAVFFLLLEVIGKEGLNGHISLGKYGFKVVAHALNEDSQLIESVIKRAHELNLLVLSDTSVYCPALVNGYSDEWSNRRRRQAILDALDASGEVSTNKIETVEKYVDKYIDNIKKVLEYFNSKTGKQYRWQSKDNQVLITARFKEGYTKEDLCKVIDNMSERWLGDEKMEQFLRPTTLFCRSKVEGYLNADKGLIAKWRH